MFFDRHLGCSLGGAARSLNQLCRWSKKLFLHSAQFSSPITSKEGPRPFLTESQAASHTCNFWRF